jgi:hypothetical protein
MKKASSLKKMPPLSSFFFLYSFKILRIFIKSALFQTIFQGDEFLIILRFNWIFSLFQEQPDFDVFYFVSVY